MSEISVNRSKTGNARNGIGIRFYSAGMVLAAILALAAIAMYAPAASASSGYFTGAGGCSACHVGQTGSSFCGMCHAHGVHASSSKTGINVTAATNKSTYAPGETVSVTISGGYRASQARAILYDQNGVQVAVSTGTPSSGGGPVNAPLWPVTLTAPAPGQPGTYTWKAAWYGNKYDSGSATFGAAGTAWIADPNNPDHGEERVSTNSFTVAAADTTPPTVSSTSPGNNATGVAVGAAVTATFSEAIAPASVTASSFTLSGGVTGTVSVSGSTATFTPSAPLANSTTYTATLTTAIRDNAGNALASNYNWAFTTASAADTTPPTVSSTSPASDATGVAVSAAVTATFSEAVAPASVTASSFTLGGVTGTVSVSGSTATFTPAAPLANNTTYTATITTAVTDIAGNHLAANRTWSFTTTSAVDTTPPLVNAVSPSDTQTGVPANAVLTVTFSEAVDVPAGAFTVRDGSGSVPGTVSVSGAAATFTPSAILSDNTTYTATLTTAVTDLAGNPLAADYSSSFTTGAAAPPPVVNLESSGGGCAIARSGGSTGEIDGAFGFLVLTGLGMGTWRRVKRKAR